jgi:septum formation topological specificity factor MinE
MADTREQLRDELDDVICRMWEIGMSDVEVQGEIKRVFDEHPEASPDGGDD